MTSDKSIAARREAVERKMETMNRALSVWAVISLVAITIHGAFLLPYFVIQYGWAD